MCSKTEFGDLLARGFGHPVADPIQGNATVTALHVLGGGPSHRIRKVGVLGAPHELGGHRDLRQGEPLVVVDRPELVQRGGQKIGFAESCNVVARFVGLEPGIGGA